MDVSKLRQAAVEFAYTFALLFVLSFAGWASGWTRLPNVDEAKAALLAAGTAAVVGAAKGLLWFISGTKAPPQ